MSPVQDKYDVRHAARSERLRVLTRRDRWISELRLVVFLAAPALLFAIFGPPQWPLYLLALPLGLFLWLVVVHERVSRDARRAAAAVKYYEDGLARIADKWAGRGLPGDDLKPAEHVYAEDLDIFGRGSLFELLCAARTRAGERTLARWLCAPAKLPELAARQDAVADLRARLDARESLWLAGGELQPRWLPQAVEGWATASRHMPPVTWWWLVGLLSLVPFGMAFVGWKIGGAGWGFLILGALPGLALQRLWRDRISAVARAESVALRELSDFARVASCVEGTQVASPRLRELQQALAVNGRSASKAVALLARLSEWKDAGANPMFAPIALAVMWQTHFAFALEWWKARYGARVREWFEAVGEFEALCSLATYAFENPEDAFPAIDEGAARFEGDALGHPLLPRSSCVRNGVKLGAAPALLMVSGSNMSGKSTLLRTVGINAVLAMAGAPVRATKLAMSPLQVGASMHIVDSIQRGTSHFYAEILRLKDIRNLAAGPRPVLFLIDEILHGTNSHDRSIGADAVLRGLIETGAIGLVTTHDLALTSIAGSLGHRAANVHFVDHLERGKLVFDYTVRSGVVQRSNAVELMRQIGLDV